MPGYAACCRAASPLASPGAGIDKCRASANTRISPVKCSSIFITEYEWYSHVCKEKEQVWMVTYYVALLSLSHQLYAHLHVSQCYLALQKTSGKPYYNFRPWKKALNIHYFQWRQILIKLRKATRRITFIQCSKTRL